MTASTEIEIHQRPVGALAVSDAQTEWSTHQHAALAQLGVGDAPLGDQLVLLHQAQRTGLDPFAKQIYMIGRSDSQAQGGKKWTIQTGIDGYRVIARRTADRRGETLGYEDTLWCGENGQWVDVWLHKQPPAAAKVTVLRAGERFSAVARFVSYAQTKYGGGLTRQWATMPDVMIAKCAEALALRKAFPHDLAGIYTDEEMGQADNPPPVDVTGTAHVAPANGHVAGGNGHLPAAPPVRSEAEQAEWHTEWSRRFEAAATIDDLTFLGRAVQVAERSGHCPPGAGDTFRQLLRTRSGEMPATEAHLTRLHAALGNHPEITSRDEKLAAVSRILGRDDDNPVTSTTELTCAEADVVWQAARDAPPGLDLVTGLLVPAGAGVAPGEWPEQPAVDPDGGMSTPMPGAGEPAPDEIGDK